MDVFRYEVEVIGSGVDTSFYAWRQDGLILWSYDANATVDLRHPLVRDEWDRLYDGQPSWDQLRAAIEDVYQAVA